MRALIYLRVSTEGQARKENPISTQREACLNYARQYGYEVNLEEDILIDGGLSGRTDNREAFQRIFERIAKDKSIKAIIAFDISRISRNLAVYLDFKKKLKKYDVRFFSVSEPLMSDETPAAKMIENMLASFAEFRSGQDGEKIRLGMKNKAENGTYVGRAPFGYKNVRSVDYGGKDRRWMETDQDEAVWVKRAFERYATGQYSLDTLSKELADEGFPTRNGKPLRSSSLQEVLKRRIYIGWVEWGGITNPNGKHEKLVSDEMFEKVQMIFKARLHDSDRLRKHTFLLRGIMRCGECGSRVTASFHRGRKGKRYGYYECPKRQHGKKVQCGQVAIPLWSLEDEFQMLFKQIQITDAVAARLRAKIKAILKKRGQLELEAKKAILNKLERIDYRKKSLLEKYVDGKVDDGSYEIYKAQLESHETTSKQELAKIEDSIAQTAKVVEVAIGLANNCYRAFQKASPDHKRLLARAFFEKLIVKDKLIAEAHLNHPFVFICEKGAKQSPVFQLDRVGGDGGSCAHVQEDFPETSTSLVLPCGQTKCIHWFSTIRRRMRTRIA